MTDEDRTRRSDSHGSSSSPARRAGGGSSVIGAASRATSTATDPIAADQTVISTSPPIELQPAGHGFKPSELGQALEGQQLEHVLLEEFVGGGGMGAVFRAWDTELYRTVAVKVLSTHQAGDVESQRRFQTEARSAARLDHPNIARVHYVGEDRGIRYIVFEYIEGTNVRDLVNVNGPLPLADALNFTLQIANALSHAWEREVVHRDIKPSNILITPEGLAKLVDMGLARFEQIDGAAPDETATGVTLGTFDYISPEQARNPRDTDTRSDIYSLGCTLYFMLTGRAPFADGSALQKLLLHQSEPPPDVREVRPDVSEMLATVLATMLAKRPEDRFQNPNELAAALVGCIEQLGIAPPQVALPAYWSNWVPRPTWWRRHAAWLVPAALLLAAVLVLGLRWNSEAASPRFPPLKISNTEQTAAPAASAIGDRDTGGRD
jgi:serine/threonine-protein kinase